MMKLFYAPNACSLASHIALEEAGAPYEAVRIDFGKAEQSSRSIWRSIPRAVCRRW
jgi:glutathione S-transferase